MNLSKAQQLSLSIGDTFPNFQYKGMFQKENKLSGLKGSYVLIHFWASWNTESREMQLEFIPVYSKFKEKKFSKGKKFYIVSISLDKEEKLFELATKKDNLPWSSSYCDFKGWQSELISRCGIQQIPSNFLLNPEGKIIAININAAELEQFLRGF
ncbi:MAG: TlpA family protein disulfide reductase [Bacteroidia bacterium]